ncbi:MAG: peptidylprolyl isomerase [Bacillota bacterium]
MGDHMSPNGEKSGGAKSGGGSKSRPKGGSRDAAGRGASNWLLWAVLLLLVVAAGAFYFTQRGDKEGFGTPDVVKIETTKGLIVMEVYPDLVPVTVKNFEDLAKSGFYDGLIWHRVEHWVVQTGDPQGTGYGGSGKNIKLEINRQLSNVRGAVGMARSQARDSATSQFYILKADATGLDGDYAIFGKVIQGMDVVDQLAIGDKMLKVTVEPGTPAK